MQGESPTYILNEDTQLVIRAIGVSHTACKDEFRRNIRTTQLECIFIFNILPGMRIPPCRRMLQKEKAGRVRVCGFGTFFREEQKPKTGTPGPFSLKNGYGLYNQVINTDIDSTVKSKTHSTSHTIGWPKTNRTVCDTSYEYLTSDQAGEAGCQKC